MPQIDLKTTYPYCHGEASENLSISSSQSDGMLRLSFSRYCIGNCEIYRVWNLNGIELDEKCRFITIGYLYIGMEYASD